MSEPLKIVKFVGQVFLGIGLIVGGVNMAISDEPLFGFLSTDSTAIKAIGIVVMILGVVLLKGSVSKKR